MKRKILLRTALLATTLMLFGSVGWGQVIISQYYEGSSNNKWIEITNVGSGTVDLTSPQLYICLYTNTNADAPDQNTTITSTQTLSGSLNSGQSLLLKNSSAVLPSYSTGTNSGTCTFNGDDLLILTSASGVGESGAWNNRIDIVGNGDSWGTDKSFVRKNTIITPSNTFNISDWDEYSNSQVDNATSSSSEYLGYHLFESGEPTKVATPTFDPVAGTYTEPTDVTISTSTEGATVYYSLMSETGPWTEYTTAVSVTETTTIWAYATKVDMDDSNVSSATYTFPVTRKWSGLGAAGDWADADNWSPSGVPTSADPVVLDNSIVTDNYTVDLPSISTTTAIKSLEITPAAGKNITLIIPATNTGVPGLNIMGTGDALILNEGAILKNSSGASSGNGFDVAGTFRINDGGRYIHNTTRGSSTNVSKLSTVAGTENGIFELDVPVTAFDFTISASGRTYGTLVFSATGGARNYVASGVSNLTINGSLIVNANAAYTSSLTAEVNVAQNIETEALGVLSFSKGSMVNVGGNLINNGTLNLNSDTDKKLASIIVTGTQSGSGTINYQRYMPTTVFEYVSSPVASQTASVFGTLGANSGEGNGLFAFDVTADSWTAAITNGATPIVAMQGYAFIANSNQTVTFSGTGFYSGEQSIGLIKGASTGFNLVGNPYPAPINWDFDGDWVRENVTPNIWINIADAPTESNFATYNSDTDLGTNWIGNIGDEEGVIPPTQAFWVEATAATTLTVYPTAQQHSANTVTKKSTNENPLIRLQAQRSGYSDEMVIFFHSEATEGMDRYDTRKKLGSGAYPQIYAPVADAIAAVNTLPQSLLSERVVVPITLKSDMAGSITIALTELKNLGDDMNITLTDKATGSQTDLRTAAYTVEVEAGSTLTNRFEVIIERKNTTSAPAIDKSTVNIYASAKNIYVGMAQQGSSVEVYNTIGVQMMSQKLNGGAVESIQTNLPKGVYIVVVNGSEGRTVKRIFIN